VDSGYRRNCQVTGRFAIAVAVRHDAFRCLVSIIKHVKWLKGKSHSHKVPDGSGELCRLHAGQSVTWRMIAITIGLIFVMKIIVIAWGVYAAKTGELSRRDYLDNFHHHRIISRWHDPTRIRFFELWVTSDAQWYNAIAEHGYPSKAQFDSSGQVERPKLIASTDTRLKYAFFPLWPMTIRMTMAFIDDVDAAGFVAANLISLAALAMFFVFLARRTDTIAAFWVVVLFAASPFAMFLHVPYTESLFFLLAVATFFFVERENWVLAGICIGLASITRPNGVALAVVPIAYGVVETVRRRGWCRRQFPGALGLTIAAIPLLAFLWFCKVRVGDALVFNEVREWWGYGEFAPISNLWHNTVGTALDFFSLPLHGFHRSRIDFLVLALASLTWILGLRRLPAHYSAYAFCILAIPLAGKGDLMSFSRYALMAWPLFITPVLLVPVRIRFTVLPVTALVFLYGQAICIAEFVNWHWVG